MFAFFMTWSTESLLLLGIYAALVIPFLVFPFWMVSTKAGFPGWFSLAVFVPVLNIVFFYYLAFAEWPAIGAARHDTSRLT